MIVLALAMLFSLSMVSFATGDEVSVIVRYRDYDFDHNVYLNPVQLDSFNSELTATNTNVYTVVYGKYSNASVWNNASGNMYLEGLTINNVSYEDVRVEADDSCFDPDDECTYIGGDTTIDALDLLPEFIACGGVYMSIARLFEDEDYNGYYFTGDGLHACSITYDWMYEVDFADDNVGFVDPGVVMSSCNLSDGDTIRLTYGLVWKIFPIAQLNSVNPMS